MSIAVIGAGWAGLAAACRLRSLGHSVVAYEASPTLGGRARRVFSRSLDTGIDNGQHILLGAYTETLGLMQQLGLDPTHLFHRKPLHLERADGQFSLAAHPLPAPLHLLSGLLTARGLTIVERLAAVRLMASLQRSGWRTAPGATVASWLQAGGQSPSTVKRLWQPLCLAALNTPTEEAGAQLFANVLRDSFSGGRTASDILIPSVDLSRLWPDAAESYLAADPAHSSEVRRRTPVRHLSISDKGACLDGQRYQAVIVATNAPAALRLLEQLPPTDETQRYLQPFSQFQYLPIATVSYRLAHPWGLQQPMLMLQDDPARMHFGQWLFDRTARSPGERSANTETPPLLHVVVSDARAMLGHGNDEVAAAVQEQIAEQTGRFAPLPPILAQDVIIEKRATFAALPGLLRPRNTSPWPEIWVAGDWTDTGYPGVLEGAVRSGLQAADEVHRSLPTRPESRCRSKQAQGCETEAGEH